MWALASLRVRRGPRHFAGDLKACFVLMVLELCEAQDYGCYDDTPILLPGTSYCVNLKLFFIILASPFILCYMLYTCFRGIADNVKNNSRRQREEEIDRRIDSQRLRQLNSHLSTSLELTSTNFDHIHTPLAGDTETGGAGPNNATSCATPPAPEPKSLSVALEDANLGQYEIALRDLGAVVTADLAGLEDADMAGMGMKKLEIARLKRVIKAQARATHVGTMAADAAHHESSTPPVMVHPPVRGTVPDHQALSYRGGSSGGGWAVGDVVDVETEDGWERGVTILGPAGSGSAAEMSVQFADGVVDDWEISEFREIDAR